MSMLKLTSCPSSIGQLETFVQRLATEYNISRERYPDILISLTEAVNNAIIHGNEANKAKCVCINHRLSDSRLSFTISDEGRGFDPASIPDPTCADNIETLGGRGVFLMTKLSDSIHFVNNGSTVVIDFKI